MKREPQEISLEEAIRIMRRCEARLRALIVICAGALAGSAILIYGLRGLVSRGFGGD